MRVGSLSKSLWFFGRSLIFVASLCWVFSEEAPEMTFLIIFYCVVIPCLIMFVLLFPQTSFMKQGHSYQCHGSMKRSSETCANKLLCSAFFFNLILWYHIWSCNCPYMSFFITCFSLVLNFLCSTPLPVHILRHD